MSMPYFRQVPDFDYINIKPESNSINNYVTVKNLFKRGKIRDDIFENVNFFTKYNIIGDERPDNVAYKLYEDSTLDWVILLSNNILNLQTEWPLPQNSFDEIMLEKYGSYENLYSAHHYETIEVRDSQGFVLVPSGIHVDENFALEYYESTINDNEVFTQITREVSNYEYEMELQDKRRSIYCLKPKYLNILLNDLEKLMEYKKGSGQYVSRTLKRGDNIKIYS